VKSSQLCKHNSRNCAANDYIIMRNDNFLLIHGNGVHEPARIAEMVSLCKQVAGYRPMPIVFNEDDHIINMRGVFYWTNPESEFYGDTITTENMAQKDQFLEFTAPYYKKLTVISHEGLSVDNASGEPHDNGRIFKDWYVMRLPETYLLRAEAYHLKGENTNAAADINVIRNRAQATPVLPGEVDLDMILDERARELYIEDFRVSTLLRMGKFAEYLEKYNSFIISTGATIPSYMNKLPIPNAEIGANINGGLEQNPGY